MKNFLVQTSKTVGKIMRKFRRESEQKKHVRLPQLSVKNDLSVKQRFLYVLHFLISEFNLKCTSFAQNRQLQF